MNTGFNRIAALDGLRGFLALWVLLYHFGLENFFQDGWSWLNPFFAQGVSSPRYFFVISGFLIMGIYLGKHGHSRQSVLSFFIQRFFRIFPLFWSVGLGCMLLGLRPFDKIMFNNMLLIFGFIPTNVDQLPILVSWSLYVEEFFYLLTPLLVLKIKNLPTAAFSLFAFYFTSDLLNGLADRLSFQQNTLFTAVYSLSFLFMGFVVYFIFYSELRPKKKFSLLPYFTDALTLMVLFLLWKGDHVNSLLTGFLLLTSALNSKGFLRKIWSSELLMFLGKRCFSFYLIHTLVLQYAFKPLYRTLVVNEYETSNIIVFTKLGLALGLVLAVTEVLYRCIEKPSTRLGYRLTERFFA